MLALLHCSTQGLAWKCAVRLVCHARLHVVHSFLHSGNIDTFHRSLTPPPPPSTYPHPPTHPPTLPRHNQEELRKIDEAASQASEEAAESARAAAKKQAEEELARLDAEQRSKADVRHSSFSCESWSCEKW
jgi:hypothetical protein